MVDVPDSYHVDRELMFVVGDYVVPGETRPRPGSKVMLRRDAKNRSLPTFFVDAEPAETYARAAVESARENLRAALDVEALVAHAQAELERTEGEHDEVQPPVYSADPEIAAIQRSYWDVLTGRRSELLRPGATAEMYRERLDEIGELQAGRGARRRATSSTAARPRRRCGPHAEDVPFELIGTWEPETHDVDGEWVEQRFDPARVAKYMTSPTGQWSNLDNLASRTAPLRGLRRRDAGHQLPDDPVQGPDRALPARTVPVPIAEHESHVHAPYRRHRAREPEAQRDDADRDPARRPGRHPLER